MFFLGGGRGNFERIKAMLFVIFSGAFFLTCGLRAEDLAIFDLKFSDFQTGQFVQIFWPFKGMYKAI